MTAGWPVTSFRRSISDTPFGYDTADSQRSTPLPGASRRRAWAIGQKEHDNGALLLTGALARTHTWAVDEKCLWREATYSVVDVETTGLDLDGDEIVSVGAAHITVKPKTYSVRVRQSP